MLTLATIWWLFFWTALGLSVGSFLNCVIFRLPRNRSLNIPIWSACPYCRKRIRWYDNIPVLSFMLLAGRCRNCGVPIATRYVVIELASVLIVLMLLDAFFIGHVRAGLTHPALGLTEQLANDWPILLAHIILFACLLAMSAIDLEHYWVDVRFTNLVTFAGFVLHTLWTPAHSKDWVRPYDTTAVMAVFALAGLGLVWVLIACRPHEDEPEYESPEPEPAAGNGPAAASLPPSLTQPSRAAGWIAGLFVALLLLALFLDAAELYGMRYLGRPMPLLILFFLLILSENIVSRESDHAIVDAIHEERFYARRMVLAEFGLLAPALVLALIGLWLMRSNAGLAERVGDALNTEFHIPFIPFMQSWMPLQGFATAAAGYLLAGAIGWAVRIGFTLAFGKEAFGAGDIHMMAAAGCVAGWPIVLIGFFICCPLALLGWAASLPFKRSRALPLGPWLAFSFLIVVVLYEPILQTPFMARAMEALQYLLLRNSQPAAIGIMP